MSRQTVILSSVVVAAVLSIAVAVGIGIHRSNVRAEIREAESVARIAAADKAEHDEAMARIEAQSKKLDERAKETERIQASQEAEKKRLYERILNDK